VKANVYVDGLSLYYSALKRTPYKWLYLRKLARLLLPGDRIHRIRYFTSLPTYLYHDRPRGQRVQAYIRALETLRALTVHYGTCRAEIESVPVPGSPGNYARFTRRWEKGSTSTSPR